MSMIQIYLNCVYLSCTQLVLLTFPCLKIVILYSQNSNPLSLANDQFADLQSKVFTFYISCILFFLIRVLLRGYNYLRVTIDILQLNHYKMCFSPKQVMFLIVIFAFIFTARPNCKNNAFTIGQTATSAKNLFMVVLLQNIFLELL